MGGRDELTTAISSSLTLPVYGAWRCRTKVKGKGALHLLQKERGRRLRISVKNTQNHLFCAKLQKYTGFARICSNVH
jgi:hypothetical protein